MLGESRSLPEEGRAARKEERKEGRGAAAKRERKREREREREEGKCNKKWK